MMQQLNFIASNFWWCAAFSAFFITATFYFLFKKVNNPHDKDDHYIIHIFLCIILTAISNIILLISIILNIIKWSMQ